MSLTREEVIRFKEDGFLIKRSVLDPTLIARAREEIWKYAPPWLDRNKPQTWIGAFSDDYWSWRVKQFREEVWMLKLLIGNEVIWDSVEQLLGKGCIHIPQQVRGVYCIFPEGDVPETLPYFHVDEHPFHIGLLGYIDDVPPGGGGFTVCSGSHLRLYYEFESAYKFLPKQSYQTTLDHLSKQSWIECSGRAGDVIFWHHRLAHAAGGNRSSLIRQAILGDFWKKDIVNKLGQPPDANMWQDWKVRWSV